MKDELAAEVVGEIERGVDGEAPHGIGVSGLATDKADSDLKVGAAFGGGPRLSEEDGGPNQEQARSNYAAIQQTRVSLVRGVKMNLSPCPFRVIANASFRRIYLVRDRRFT